MPTFSGGVTQKTIGRMEGRESVREGGRKKKYRPVTCDVTIFEQLQNCIFIFILHKMPVTSWAKKCLVFMFRCADGTIPKPVWSSWGPTEINRILYAPVQLHSGQL